MWYSVFCSNESIYTVGKLNDPQSASCLDRHRRDAAEERDLVVERGVQLDRGYVVPRFSIRICFSS